MMRWLRPFISRRAVATGEVGLHVLSAMGAASVEHVLNMPRGACPVSKNPVSGTIRIAYQPTQVVIELVSLHRVVEHAARHNPDEARSVEGLARWLHRQLEAAVDVPVVVELDVVVMPGRQRYRVRYG